MNSGTEITPSRSRCRRRWWKGRTGLGDSWCDETCLGKRSEPSSDVDEIRGCDEAMKSISSSFSSVSSSVNFAGLNSEVVVVADSTVECVDRTVVVVVVVWGILCLMCTL